MTTVPVAPYLLLGDEFPTDGVFDRNGTPSAPMPGFGSGVYDDTMGTTTVAAGIATLANVGGVTANLQGAEVSRVGRDVEIHVKVTAGTHPWTIGIMELGDGDNIMELKSQIDGSLNVQWFGGLLANIPAPAGSAPAAEFVFRVNQDGTLGFKRDGVVIPLNPAGKIGANQDRLVFMPYIQGTTGSVSFDYWRMVDPALAPVPVALPAVPTITALSPQGWAGPATAKLVTVTGTGFQTDGFKLTVDGVEQPADSVVVTSDTSLKFTRDWPRVYAQEDKVIGAVNAGGAATVTKAWHLYAPRLSVVSVTPTPAVVEAGATFGLVIVGTGFESPQGSPPYVGLGTTDVGSKITAWTDTSITLAGLTAPAVPAGQAKLYVDVVIKTPAQEDGTQIEVLPAAVVQPPTGGGGAGGNGGGGTGWWAGFRHDDGALVTATADGAWLGGFVRKDGALCVTTAAGKWNAGFVRDDAGKLCITQDATGAKWNGGFLRGNSGAGPLVTTTSRAGAIMVGGYLRAPNGALVTA